MSIIHIVQAVYLRVFDALQSWEHPVVDFQHISGDLALPVTASHVLLVALQKLPMTYKSYTGACP